MNYYFVFEIQTDGLWKFHCKKASLDDAKEYITKVDPNSDHKWKAILGIGYDISTILRKIEDLAAERGWNGPR